MAVFDASLPRAAKNGAEMGCLNFGVV